MVTVFVRALFANHQLLQLLINITLVLVKTLSKNVTITISVLIEMTKSREKSTELSNYVWELKEKDINYFINWDMAMKSQKYICGSRECELCISGKLLIARADTNVLLNTLDELPSKDRHGVKFTLKCFRDNLYYSVYVTILAFFAGINIEENNLMIGNMKHSVMVICCC